MSTVFPNITKCESRVDGLWAAAVGAINNAVGLGMDPIERLRFLAPGTGAREGGEKTQPFNRFPSHCVTVLVLRMAHRKRKETKQLPSLLPGPVVPGSSLVSFHILWAILSTGTVEVGGHLRRQKEVYCRCRHEEGETAHASGRIGQRHATPARGPI